MCCGSSCINDEKMRKLKEKGTAAWENCQNYRYPPAAGPGGAVRGVKKAQLPDDVKAELKEFYQWNKKEMKIEQQRGVLDYEP